MQTTLSILSLRQGAIYSEPPVPTEDWVGPANVEAMPRGLLRRLAVGVRSRFRHAQS